MGTVLVAGAPGVGKATLLQALQATKSAGKDPCLYNLRLDTKYYDVELLVHCHDAHSVALDHLSSSGALDHLQALVLVIDSSCKRSHESVMQFYESFPEGEFDIQLLVANKVDSSSTPSAWLQDARTWCYSNGFEYIEAAAGNPRVDATLNEDGEQQGVARVLAALQAHMWPNMQSKPRSQHTSSHSAAAAASSLTGSSAPVSGPGSSSCGISSSTRDQGRAISAADPTQNSLQKQQHKHKQGQGHEQQQQQVEQAVGLSGQPSTTDVDAVPTPQRQQGTPDRPPAAESLAATKEQCEQQQQQQQKGLGASAAVDLDDNPFLDADPDDFEQLMRQVMGEFGNLQHCCM
jgi:hypothetical protein